MLTGLQAGQKEVQHREELRVALDELRRFEAIAQARSEEVDRLGAENARLAAELEESAKKHLEAITESLAEVQKLRLELEASNAQGIRMSTEIGLLKQSEQRQADALRRANGEINELSCQIEELTRQAAKTQVR